MERKRLLITCFEPFGGRIDNASQRAVEALPDVVGPFELHRVCLPVAFGRAADLTCAEAERLCPHAIVCVGEAAGRSALTPEMAALNLRYARIPDNDGNQPQDEPVVPGGENALFATLPVRALARAIRVAGLPAEVSYSAGTYVCNDLMYRMLRHAAPLGTPCGFVHVPAEELDAAQLAAGLAAALEELGRLA